MSSTNGSSVALTATYEPNYTHRASALDGEAHATDAAVLGLTNLSRYELEGVNTGERAAFVECVQSFYLDEAARARATVKVNVAWDESDYQIDVGTEAGRGEYKRIIDRNAQFGVTHVVYEPRNTRLSNRHNSTDGWGWEGSLWFGYGQRLREGNWAPGIDAVDPTVSEMVAYARSKGVQLLAYVYPCLLFEAQAQAALHGALDLSAAGVKEWLADTLVAFITATGAGGFAWDHDIFAPEGGGMLSTGYAQWRAWMQILRRLRQAHPDVVMDHRQTAHMWGPWYHLAGSYAEPIAGDENPETYGVPIASLHADHVAADNTRRVNYRYAAQQLLPPSRVPGFIFHQTERTTDNGTNPCFGNEVLCFDNNTRDFDLIGYKYSVLSTVGTAGLNNVVCMIPARDQAEYALLPKPDLDFIHGWLAWTDAHQAALRFTAPIATLRSPALGSVDGTHAMLDGEGFLFLFNPALVPLNATLYLDESVGLSNASIGSRFAVYELYPQPRERDGWVHGQTVQVLVDGASALVLQLTKAKDISLVAHTGGSRVPSARLVGVGGHGVIDSAVNGLLEWHGAYGVAGMAMHAKLVTDATTVLDGVRINGRRCETEVAEVTKGWALTAAVKTAAEPDDEVRVTEVRVSFGGGSPVRRLQPLGALPPVDNTGGNWTLNFSIGSGVFAQLAARQRAYPIDWQPAERNATWLVPSRLLASIFIANPQDDWLLQSTLDGHLIPVHRSYNSRGLVRPRCFLGFYLDLSAAGVSAEQPHTLKLRLPARLPQGAYAGVFLENLETEYTSAVAQCHVRLPGPLAY